MLIFHSSDGEDGHRDFVNGGGNGYVQQNDLNSLEPEIQWSSGPSWSL